MIVQDLVYPHYNNYPQYNSYETNFLIIASFAVLVGIVIDMENPTI